MTLLDTLRNKLDHTAAKRVCDRGTCGACTVIMDGKAVYACTVLAIDAQGKKIQTLEGLSQNGKPAPRLQAFVNNDAQQCGYCTPGFVMATKNFLDHHPQPDRRAGESTASAATSAAAVPIWESAKPPSRPRKSHGR